MSLSEGGTHRPGIYYGWIIVAVALVSMAFWLGIRSSFSVFYVALLEDFHWTRAGSASVQSIAIILAIAVLLVSCIFIWLAAPRKFRR